MSELQASLSPQAVLEACLRGSAGSLSLDLALELRCPWTVLYGPSGAGKSTVLRGLCGLTTLPEQHVVVKSEDLTRVPVHRRGIALVSQNTALFPHMTAMGNVLFGLRARSLMQRSERAREAQCLLERFHCGDAASKFPRSLSGGEKQRVALARALASSPRLLLLDEAFTGLQSDLRTELVGEVKRWQRECDAPVISVTHDVVEALACADEAVRIADGRIVAQGSPADVLADERAALVRQLR